MMVTTLVIDVSYLAWRAFYSTGSLSYLDRPSGVLYGFFKTLESLKARFAASRCVFCFDAPPLLRADAYPPYKAKRKDVKRTPEEAAGIADMKGQIDNLRDRLLAGLGYNNVLSAAGYEADDMIAVACRALHTFPPRARTLVVSGDKDLYQLLRHRTVAVYHPVQDCMVTQAKFVKAYGVHPDDWATVKAVSGCLSDNVKGIPGVGEKTALRFVRKELPEKSQAFATIRTFYDEVIGRNLPLVTLPYADAHRHAEFDPKDDKPSPRAWRAFCREFGFASLVDKDFRGQKIR